MGSHFVDVVTVHIPWEFTSRHLSRGTTPQMELYNKSMSEVRMAVEMLFGTFQIILNLLTSKDK